MLSLLRECSKSTHYYYSAFLAYLWFKGYHHPSLQVLTTLPLNLTRQHRPALLPIRQRLQAAYLTLGYAGQGQPQVGRFLTLLIDLLIVAAKPLEELTRPDFEAFRDRYQLWYRTVRRGNGRLDHRLACLEQVLVHWGILPRAKHVFRHEQHFAQIRPAPIREAILTYMHWCDGHYQPSTINSCRASIYGFFLWLQETYPQCDRLDAVTRTVAVAYANELKRRMEAGVYSGIYRNDLYRRIRLFYDFVIEERLATSPDRNPFGLRDVPRVADPVVRYLTDAEVRTLLAYCERGASLLERVAVITLLHTGIRAAEFATLKATDVVQIQGHWKLHIHAGKGLKDRLIPLTPPYLAVLRDWQAHGWTHASEHLFSSHGRPWSGVTTGAIIRELGRKLGLAGLTPHRFRHTFAVALLNYGMRESALQKLMGHTTLNMTLEYARILDQTVERSFAAAVDQMQSNGLSWVPNFLAARDFAVLAEGDTLSWIVLPHGYCRRNPQLHCESDVKCLLCERFAATATDLPKLQAMQQRFVQLGLTVKADVVSAQICRLTSIAAEAANQVPLLAVP